MQAPLPNTLPTGWSEAAADRVCLQVTAMAATSDEVQAAAALPRELQQLVTTFASVGSIVTVGIKQCIGGRLKAPGHVVLLTLDES